MDLRQLALYFLLLSVFKAIQLRSSSMMESSAPSDLKPWADGPIKLVTTPQYQTEKTDLFTKGATHMALLHNSILRGFNSIYNQASHIQKVDAADFIGYCLAWHKFVKSHHDDEEQNLFPKIEALLEDKSIFAETHKEHEAFLDGLEEFEDYLKTIAVTPSQFSSRSLLYVMDGFRVPFETHFHSEISTISELADHPNAPATGSPEAASASAVFQAWGKSTVTKAGVFDVVPLFLLNLDHTAEGGMWASWPPMPAPVRWGLVNIAGAWNYRWWKFSSCNSAGQPRELWALQFPLVDEGF